MKSHGGKYSLVLCCVVLCCVVLRCVVLCCLALFDVALWSFAGLDRPLGGGVGSSIVYFFGPSVSEVVDVVAGREIVTTRVIPI